MATTTVVGIFDDETTAERAAKQLEQEGISSSDIHVTGSDYSSGSYRTGYGERATQIEDGGGVGGFFRNLFGSDVSDDDRGLYAEAVRRGSHVVTVDVDETSVERVATLLSREGAVDIDRRSEQYRSSGFTSFDETAPMYTREQRSSEFQTYGASTDREDVAIPVIEEELQVGKRSVQRGGVRVHTRISERPVTESVTLREERVHVERHPVNRDVTTADLDSMRDEVVEVSTVGEEAVVGKKARVVEEVTINKEMVEREETVRDTVRRTDVDVQDVAADEGTITSRRR